jgi:hypothetical protein
VTPGEETHLQHRLAAVRSGDNPLGHLILDAIKDCCQAPEQVHALEVESGLEKGTLHDVARSCHATLPVSEKVNILSRPRNDPMCH